MPPSARGHRSAVASQAPVPTSQWNLAGIPAMAVPVGFSPEHHMPLSMQIICAAYDEAAAFKVGDATSF